jgi:hypothetical protein
MTEQRLIEEARRDNDVTDNDLALGIGNIASSTTLISSSIMKYREENGRN